VSKKFAPTLSPTVEPREGGVCAGNSSTHCMYWGDRMRAVSPEDRAPMGVDPGVG
jgi:hypothetical protein